MDTFPVVLALHVLAAVLGTGQVLAMVLVAHQAVRQGDAPQAPLALLKRLNLAATLGLLVLLITGVWLVRTHDLGPVPLWLKVSLGLFVLAGAILGIMRAVIRRALAATPAARPIYLRRVRYETFALTLLVTAIVTLMTVK